MDTSLERTNVKKLYCVWSNMFTLNKTHTMILVCAVDYFLKISENAEISFLKNNHKKPSPSKIQGLCVFSSGLDGFEITCTSIRKKCTQNPYFLHKFDFCIFEPKNCDVINNSSKAPLNFSPYQCTYMYLGKNHFDIISAKSEKMKLKSGHLELRFSVATI